VWFGTFADYLNVKATVSFQVGKRIIGEDKNLDGVFDVLTEDANGNGKYDSPVSVTTIISDRGNGEYLGEQ